MSVGVVVIAVCGLLVCGGIVAVVRWGGLPLQPPPPVWDGWGEVRRALWWADLLVLSGLASGLLIAGPGGRLVMRLLAVTAGDDAQGLLTEAEERVGEITVGGTIAFVVFGGLFAGLVSAVAYLALRRWLPVGRVGGLLLGALLLVVGATRVEPLRADNPDFDLVGPDLVAVGAFVVLVLVHGLAVVAIAGRLSHALPLPDIRFPAILAYLPVALIAASGVPFALFVVVSLLLVAASRSNALVGVWRSPTALVAGRGAICVVAFVLLPGAANAITDILRSA